MPEIILGPEGAKSMAELTTLTIDGETFTKGDRVWLEHIPSGSRIYGTLGEFYGVGRVRGIKIDGAFIGNAQFPFGQPGDDTRYRLTHVEDPKRDEQKKILVTARTMEFHVPEDWNDEQITEWLDNASLVIQSKVQWESWKYEEEWRG